MRRQSVIYLCQADSSCLVLTLQQRIDATDQYNLSRQDLLGKQQAVCSPGVRENQNRSCPVPFWLPSFIFLVPSPEWSLGPDWLCPMQITPCMLCPRPIRERYANGAYVQDQSAKRVCWARSPAGSLHSGVQFLILLLLLRFFPPFMYMVF